MFRIAIRINNVILMNSLFIIESNANVNNKISPGKSIGKYASDLSFAMKNPKIPDKVSQNIIEIGAILFSFRTARNEIIVIKINNIIAIFVARGKIKEEYFSKKKPIVPEFPNFVIPPKIPNPLYINHPAYFTV